MTISRKPVGVVAILLIGLAVFLWSRSGETAPTTGTTGLLKSNESPVTDANQHPRRSAASRPPLARKDADYDSPEAIHFRNFYLRPISLFEKEPPTPLSLSEAVSRVKAEYLKIAGEAREPHLPLAIDLTQANTDQPVTFRLPRAPVTSALRLLAAASGNRLIGNGPDFRMVSLGDESRRSDQLLPMGPNALVELGRRTAFDLAEGLGANPPAGPENGPRPSWCDAAEALRILGLQLSEDVSLEIQRGMDPTAVLKNATPSDIEKLRAVIDLLDGPDTKIQQKVDTKVIRLPADFPLETLTGGIVNDGEVQLLMRQMASTRGAELTTYPSVTARSNQTATVEMFGQVDPHNPAVRNDLTFEYHSSPVGTGSEYVVKTTRATREVNASTGEETPLTNITSSDTATTPPGYSKISMARGDDGSLLVEVHGSQRMDPTGKPVKTPPLGGN